MTHGLADQAERVLREADAAARATHGWLHQHSLQRRYSGQPLTGTEERQLAAGFLAGLRARFSLADPECLLAAYAFLLMQERHAATPFAAALLADAARCSLAESTQFTQGRQAALGLAESLPL